MNDEPNNFVEILRELSLSDLSTERQELRDVVAVHQGELVNIEAEITRRFSALGALALDDAGKDYGTVTKEMEGGYKIKAEIKQTVKWDSDALQAIASDMTWEKIQHWFKIAFSVPEAKFKAIEPGPFQKALEKARTTKLAPMKVTLIDPEGA